MVIGFVKAVIIVLDFVCDKYYISLVEFVGFFE